MNPADPIRHDELKAGCKLGVIAGTITLFGQIGALAEARRNLLRGAE